MLSAVVSCGCCFLVCLKSERDYDIATRTCSIYGAGFFYGALVFSYFTLPSRQKNQNKTVYSLEGQRSTGTSYRERLLKLHPEVFKTWPDKAVADLI